jgi:hypothetical protein
MNGFHAALAVPLSLDQVVLGIWSLVLGFRRQAVGSALASALIVDEGLIVLECAIGGALLLLGHRPDPLHFLYGGLLLGLLPVVYPYTRRRPERAGLWLGLTLLFMAGLIIRAMLTGRV